MKFGLKKLGTSSIIWLKRFSISWTVRRRGSWVWYWHTRQTDRTVSINAF